MKLELEKFETITSMPRLTSMTGCLRYDPLLKSDDQVQFTHTYIYVGINTVCPIDIVVTLAYMS